MKKIAIILALIMVSCCLPIAVYADENSNYNYVNTTVTELATDETLIVESANEIFENQFPFDINASDLNYADTIKVFEEVNISNISSFNISTFQNAVSNCEYVYLMPIEENGKKIVLTIAKGQPVTDEAREHLNEDEIAALEAKVNKWCVQAASVKSVDYNYRSFTEHVLQENSINTSEIYFIGGLSSKLPLTAVCFSADNDPVFIDLYSMKRSNGQSGGISSYDGYDYSFSEVVNSINNDVLAEGEVGGLGQAQNQGTNHMLLMVVLSAVTAALIISAFVYYKAIKKI